MQQNEQHKGIYELAKEVIETVLRVPGLTQKEVARATRINGGQLSQFLYREGSLSWEKIGEIVRWIEEQLPTIREPLASFISLDHFMESFAFLQKRLRYNILKDLYPGEGPMPMTHRAYIQRMEDGRIAKLIADRESSLVIVGAKATGKTSLVTRLVAHVARLAFTVLRIDCRAIARNTNLLAVVYARLEEVLCGDAPATVEPLSVKDAAEALTGSDGSLQNLQSTKELPWVVIFVDHLEFVEVETRKAFYTVIREWAKWKKLTEMFPATICLVGSGLETDPDIWSMASPIIRLNPFDLEQVVELATLYRLDRDAAQAVFEETRGAPAAVQKKLNELAKEYKTAR